MPRQAPPTAVDLAIAKSARFASLPKAFSKASMNTLFDEVLSQTGGARVAREVRVRQEANGGGFVYSFLCFRLTSLVPFLRTKKLEEVRYGFVLLIERKGYLAAFHRYGKGLDDFVSRTTHPVDRRRLTHIWAALARYERLSTRRMSIAKQELRSASYEADNLEMALVPATVSRSVVQTLRFTTEHHGTVGVTPSTGRVRASASRTDLGELVAFIDDTIAGIEAGGDSSFLNAFPEPVELNDLPVDVKPVGLLIDTSELQNALDDLANPHVLRTADCGAVPESLIQQLSTVLILREDDDGWTAIDDEGTAFGNLKQLTSSYSLTFSVAKDYAIEDDSGSEKLHLWLRRHSAFSVSFSSPEYFYTGGRLFRVAGFAQEVALVRRFLTVHPELDEATSEKGDPYPNAATHFAPDSIFRVVETTLASGDEQLWCCDLGDEWADYIGAGESSVTFYHCKHGSPTSGASDFQIVVGQALKNLSRVKFRRDEVLEKISSAEDREYWASTKIPLLAKGDGGWAALRRSLENSIADPTTTWQVALVATALSLQSFDKEAARSSPKPYFIQLVWLLSGFVSNCRERDAQPRIYCRT